MKRWVAVLLAAVLALGTISGCSGTTQPEQAVSHEIPAKPQSTPEASEPSAEPEAPEESEESQEIIADTTDHLSYEDEMGLKMILAGKWTYRSPITGDDQVWITFSEDGSYFLENETSGGDFIYTYSGNYEIDSWTGESADPPDMLILTLSETTDEEFGGAGYSSLGDYIISQKTLCDGEIVLQLDQANNGDSFFLLKFEDMSPVLRKETGREPIGELRKGEEFTAALWKADHQTRTVWLDDLALDGILVNDGRHESLPYAVAEQVDLFGEYPFDENALAPGEICTVVTDAEGVVQMLEPFYSRKAMLSEEEAFSILAEYEEIQLHLAQGMTMLWDGSTEEIEGANCLLIAVGTDHNEHFVQEYLYAVSDLGIAYWYDADGDAWLPLAFG